MAENFLGLVWMAAAYFLGSVNFSILVSCGANLPDPRKGGSKNAGATNVYRRAGLAWAALVLALDVGRAVAVGYGALWFAPGSLVPWVGCCLIAGNRYPVFHGFAGGKGVANHLGFSLAAIPGWAFLSALAWGGVLFKTRTPFLGSFALVLVLFTGWLFFLGNDWVGISGAAWAAAFIAMAHRGNLVLWKNSRREP